MIFLLLVCHDIQALTVRVERATGATGATGGVDICIPVPVSTLLEDPGNATWDRIEAQAKRMQQMNPAVFQAAFRATPLLKVDQAHTKVG